MSSHLDSGWKSWAFHICSCWFASDGIQGAQPQNRALGNAEHLKLKESQKKTDAGGTLWPSALLPPSLKWVIWNLPCEECLLRTRRRKTFLSIAMEFGARNVHTQTCKTPLFPLHLYHLLPEHRLLCLVISLQCFISLSRSLLFWLILWVFVLLWGLPWTCKNSMKVVCLRPLNLSSPGQFSDPAKDPNGVKENASSPIGTWRFGQQIIHWSCLLGAQNSKFMGEKLWDMWKIPPSNPI